jgi:uncharacterized protein YyaL (SSP411 family)
MATSANHLADETSPYLLQHAENPVAWYPWGEEALAIARREDKPILLSIGYSACHWCHVMAHESFEDPATARVMNELFVNIKVDREERPDLDKIYQLAHQMLVQRPGGWPLTMFLTPDEHTPFFGGTYFPNQPRHGMPAFTDVLARVATFYREHRDEIEQQSAAVRDVFRRIGRPPETGAGALDARLLTTAREQLEANFESSYGGFGTAPKFPHPTSIERLLRHWRASAGSDDPDLRALYLVTFTLQRMARGGLFDQLGGGFCRYSVDNYWMIPHFEKMLYDNGPLLALYSQAWAATNEPLFEAVAGATADWVLREMQAPDGGYYSTLDADSEGEEGKYYVWDCETVRELLDADTYPLFARVYGLDREPNFERRWHLHVYEEPATVARAHGLEPQAVEARLAEARETLLAARETRVRPARDEKVLTAWNGLMIRGMAVAARHLHRAELADSAMAATDFVRDRLWIDGRLHASWKDGRARFQAYLDDHAFLLDGVLELLQLRWRDELLTFACDLADVLLAHFQDPAGGFFFTADDHETLIHRPKPLADEATPAGNGVAALALGRLGCLLGEPRYLAAADRTIAAAAASLTEMPHAHCALLNALEEQLDPVEIVVIRGNPPTLAEWQRAALLVYAPRRLSFAIPADAAALPPGLAAKTARAGTTAYLCRGTTCSAPLASLSELTEALRESA